MAEGAGLENQWRYPSVGSNPTLSLNLVDCSDTDNSRISNLEVDASATIPTVGTIVWCV